MTGQTYLSVELNGRRIELLRDALPHIRRVAIIANPMHPGEHLEIADSRDAAKRFGISVDYLAAMNPTEIDAALVSLEGAPADAIIVLPDRPGRNFTGSTFLSLEVAQKRVQLLRELLPDLQSLAILSNTTHPGEQSEYAATQQAATALSLRLAYVPFASGRELDGALERVRTAGAGAMLVFPDGVTMVHRAKIAEFARSQRLPSMFGWREYCDAGGLASYGGNQRSTYVRLAAYADRILRGEKPADLPIEQATKFELVLNLKTARALGVDIAPTFLARADDVIE